MFYEYEHFGNKEDFIKEYDVNFNFPFHLHHSFEIIVVVSGSMEVVIQNKSHMLKKGDSVLVFPNQLHSLSSRQCEHILFIFSPELIGSYFSKYSDKIPTDNKLKLSSALFDTICNFAPQSSLYEKKSLLYSVCAEFDKSRKYIGKMSCDDKLLYSIFKFVEANYTTECNLVSLAKNFPYTYSYLSRYFKKLTGITFNEYVNQFRISKACYILTNTKKNILQCAFESGYESLRTFNRNFKLCTGVTPNQYRNRI